MFSKPEPAVTLDPKIIADAAHAVETEHGGHEHKVVDMGNLDKLSGEELADVMRDTAGMLLQVCHAFVEKEHGAGTGHMLETLGLAVTTITYVQDHAHGLDSEEEE